MSKVTRKNKIKHRITLIFSLVATFGPLAYYFITMFAFVENTQKKAVLGLSLVSAIILTLISVMMKTRIRSPLFIILLAVAMCADRVIPVITFVSIGVILDELVLDPLCKHYKNLYTINKQIDARDGE